LEVAAVIDARADGQVLAVNSGSSSLKFGLFVQQGGEEQAVLRGGADGIGTANAKLQIADAGGKTLLDEKYTLRSQGHALEEILGAVEKLGGKRPAAAGHRIVHGGPHLREHQLITDDLVRRLQAAVHFAPLHIPASVALIEMSRRLLPEIPQYACFDTVFHASMPESAYRFALPEEFDGEGVRRYGFHGLSYESVVYRLGAKIPARMVCAHLGSGSSLAAIRDGKSVDTTMGLTPTGGIPMATRSGDLDPGVLLFIMRSKGAGVEELEKMLNRDSGLGALSGGETDMRRLLEKMKSGGGKAKLAVEIFCTAVRKSVGAHAAELGGLDLLVFTGGIGEHSAEVRRRICEGLEFLGVAPGASEESSKVRVMESEEEIQIARHCRRLMTAG
jgi:acetate kinase